MKKYLILSLIFLPFVASASFDKDLYYGLQKEPQVQELQEFLAEQGVYSGPVTGNFFSLTLAAVKNFQIANSISPAVGYFGPKTRRVANQILTAKGISSTGVTNESGSTTPVVTIPPKTANDVVASLQDQIKLLQQQLATIQQQQQTLQTIQQQQASTSQQQTQILGQIQQNTTPPPAPTPAPIVPEIDKSDILVKADKTSVQINEEGYANDATFHVSILDKSGNYVKGASVSMGRLSDDILFVRHQENPSQYTLPNDYDVRSTNNITNNQLNDWNAGFTYTPTTQGTKTVTFTSGALIKSVTIEVAPYIKIDPVVSNAVSSQCGYYPPSGSNPDCGKMAVLHLDDAGNNVIGKYGANADFIGIFQVSPADDQKIGDQINVFSSYTDLNNPPIFTYDSDVPLPGILLRGTVGITDAFNLVAVHVLCFSYFYPGGDCTKLPPPGIHTVTIKTIYFSKYHSALGLPITFTFEVK